MIIVRDKKAERGYVRRALRTYPKEYLEVLWGTVKDGNVYIHSFQPIAQKANTGEVTYESFTHVEDSEDDAFSDDLSLHNEDAHKMGVTVVGKIHSHPYRVDDFDDMPSYEDIEEDDGEGLLVAGICAIGKHKGGKRFTKLAYWRIARYEKRDYPKQQ